MHFPLLSFCYVSVSVLFLIALISIPRFACAGKPAIKDKTVTQTEQKLKGGGNKMLQRNIFPTLKNEWRNIPLCYQMA